jgi:hypothetical protein
MSLEKKVSNNLDNYQTTSNYRWYYKRINSAIYNQQILGFPNFPKELPTSALDRRYEIETAFANRLDMITKKFYGNDYKNLMWVIMLYNNITNPFTGFEAGKVIYVPDRSTIQDRII